MAKKKQESGKLLYHVCILCTKRNTCSQYLPFPLDCSENNCEEYEYDTSIRNMDK